MAVESGYSSSSCSMRPASATNASTAIITTDVNETAIVGMSSVLWALQLPSRHCLPTISSDLYNRNPPPRTPPNLNCYVSCNQRGTTFVPHVRCPVLEQNSSITPSLLTAKGPPGNRATLSLWEAAPTEAKPSERSGARVCSPPGGVKTQFP